LVSFVFAGIPHCLAVTRQRQQQTSRQKLEVQSSPPVPLSESLPRWIPRPARSSLSLSPSEECQAKGLPHVKAARQEARACTHK
jgi:hypothetical protein